jgi:DNA-binding NarL/FixJ family response regulator
MVNSEGVARARIPLVSTSSLWVAGFQGLFGDPCGVEVFAVSLAEALSLRGPQTVLIDSTATSVQGRLREVLLQFRNWAPALRPIVISHEQRDDDDHIEGLIHAGARGHMNASVKADVFRAALENVQDGSLWAPRKVLSRLVLGNAVPAVRRREAPAGGVKFTPREDQVIRMLMGGRGNREIGASLGIDSVTVKAHLGRIMRKAGVGNRIELTMYALNRWHPERAGAKTQQIGVGNGRGPHIVH